MAKKNKNPNAKYAFWGLILSLAACIATAFLGLFQGMIAGGLYTPENEKLVPNLIYTGIALIVLGLASYMLLDPDSTRKFFTGRQYRYGSNSLILTIATIGILVVVNSFIYVNPLGWDLQVDMTEDKSNTLAPETLQALATLPEKVTAVAFYSQNLDSTSARELLEDFKVNSNGKFEYQFFDPDLNPLAAREAGVTGDGKILLQMGDKKEIANNADETEMTRTMIRLIDSTPRAVYFLTGHGEASIDDTQTGMSIAKTTLENKNYTVASLNLLSENKIPDDALAVIIAGPNKPVSASEVKMLKDYLSKGGSIVVLQNPRIFTEFGDAADPLGDYMKSTWGIVFDNDVIIDLNSPQPEALLAVSAYANQHPITQNLSNNYAVIMQQAISLSIETKEGITQTPLLQTSENSWGETEFSDSPDQKIQKDEGKDIPGPLNMAVAAEDPATKARVVVFGNSLFASDTGFDAYGNGNIFINAVDWAAEQDNLINITPRDTVTRTLRSDITQGKIIMLILVVIFIIPGLIIAMGIGTWLSRRRKG
jgi:ABC-type uncharacterized transport system involved in gliding motility auxiliary subunit